MGRKRECVSESGEPWKTVRVTLKPKRKREKYKLPTPAAQVEKLEKAYRWRFKQTRGGRLVGPVGGDFEFFRRPRSNLLYALNPYAQELWSGYLASAANEIGADGLAWHAVTVFSEKWDFDDFLAGEPENSLQSFLTIQGRLIRNRFRGHDFLFFADFGIHRLPGQHRYVRCPHWHGIVLGDDHRLDAIADTFGPGFGGAPGCKFKPVDEKKSGLSGWLSYMVKDPRAQYVTFKREDGKVRHVREPMTAPNQNATLEFYGDFTKPELAIASGLGAKVLRRARARAMRKGYREYDGKRQEAKIEHLPTPYIPRPKRPAGGLSDVDLDRYFKID